MITDPAKIFIPGNCPSLKNSKSTFIVNNKVNLVHSSAVRDYIKANEWVYVGEKEKFKKLSIKRIKPYKIHFFFVRKTKGRFDYINAAQIVLDLMVKSGWIDDDNANEVIPVFDGFSVDKDSPGVFIYF